MKFGRTYSMTIQTPSFGVVNGIRVPIQTGGQNGVTINFPLTLELEINRNTLASCNTASFRIYNMREDTRRQIFQDRYETTTYRQIVLRAGYDSDPTPSIIFRGNLRSAYSHRQKENWITEIEAFDGGFGVQNGQVGLTIPAGYDLKNVVRSLIQGMPNVSLGAIGEIGGVQSARGIVVNGSAWAALNQIAPDAQVFIDNEVANVIGKNEYVIFPGEPYLIEASSGLLETPRRYDRLLDVPILFEPRLRVGGLIQLNSSVPYYNGLYSVIGVRHMGVISGAISGKLISVATVFKGTIDLTGVATTA